MVVAGITQSLMWRAIDDSGKLVYPNFIETVIKIIPMYWIRAMGGSLVLISFVIMMYLLYKTAKQGSVKEEVFEAFALDESSLEPEASFHRKLEGWPMVFAVLSLVAILVGSAIEIVPSLMANNYIVKIDAVKPYTPLELYGRDIYIREGCYTCHSQTVRPMSHESLRYGKPSEAAEFVYDHPFQWGSKRTGPDLARVGGKYNHMWHYRHFYEPRQVTAGSIMPRYTWLYDSKIDFSSLSKKLEVMSKLGVPYSQDEINNAVSLAKMQAAEVAKELVSGGIPKKIEQMEVVALIAYMQRLGVDYGSLPDALSVVSGGESK
jgi:cytochrome c oxidase cbb3-type subunit I/II